jgi:CHASE2 domain-containing sensor protein
MLPGNRNTNEDIVLPAITEDTKRTVLPQWYTDRKFLARLLQKVDAEQPLVIWLDVFLDDPTDPEADEMLRQAIKELHAPFIVSTFNEAAKPSIADTFASHDQMAFVGIPESEIDGVARRFRARGRLADGTVILSGANRVMQALGRPTTDRVTEFAWDSVQAPKTIMPVTDLDRHPDTLLKGKVVMIGGMFDDYDSHIIPLGDTHQPFRGYHPGLEMLAYEVDQLMNERTSSAPGNIVNAVADLIAAGLAALLAFWNRKGVFRQLVVGLALPPVLAFDAALMALKVVPLTLGWFLAYWASGILFGQTMGSKLV